ncbi:magnesium and cobalt transport protein CorA [Pseudonocardia spinosispora]|uniref:magnesium and cobalt transport protein CorA n=1 Tax=Pseudonocardia spinosispora TaxID=103441 RepID=UPI000420183C|nr:magnesium and cobalt transport protein CorA [Pseudonocardia spinosispora]
MSLVDNVIYIDGERAVVPSSLADTYDKLQDCPQQGHSFCWIGLLRPTEAEILSVAKEFDLHPLAVEDAIDAHQRPKLERYGNTLFVVLRPARYVDPVEVVEIGELHLFLGPGFVVGVRHAEEPNIKEVRKRLEEEPELLRRGPYSVLYALLDKIVDDYGPVLDGLRNDIDEIEVQVFDGDPGASRRIYQLTREVIEFQRAVDPLPDILIMLRDLLKEHASEDDLELRRMLRDVADHVTRVVERTESFRQLLANILTVNATLVAQRQNDEMTRLTEASYKQGEQVKRISSWAAILFAPTLIAGIYGMNFTHMPEINWVLGYPMAIGLMLLMSLILYLAFKRRSWL